MSDSLDIAVSRLHGLIMSARAANSVISADPYLTALALWVSALPAVREVLPTLPFHDDTLSEVEFIYRTAVEAWLRGTVPVGWVYADDPGTAALLADDELEHRLRTALNPPANLIF
ncbi:Uncharacterised protein [Mycobacteroides abscessus subsp. abscessus]|uniref:hypothetical protein n=1 Tax=Mycobacteroides abscessus TaxID=36809 RepID=UPI0009A5E2D3|nr:hypothetical protein [Mycobacteroides abscessus]SLD05523.1 Uncharacterised protein [Mycobacteroides abscessus subsp. abscessus]SLH59783.1 Uncharacterised protein [Mycobacteroides abscessus subsp. abscessus]SLH80489.1 Uncharacterised protein [Mycobacteroides abscessus subsp. abscessus]